MIYPTFSIDPDGNQCINLIDPYFDPNEPIMSMDMMDGARCHVRLDAATQCHA